MKHPIADTQLLRAAAGRLGLDLADAQVERLAGLERMLVERAVPGGMVAASDRGRIRERHILDCLRAAGEVGTARTAYDLGSGAGLPGLVVAIAVPQLRVGLVESRRRRIAFLELAVAELEVPNAVVLASRVEDLQDPVELCWARAFAPLERAWALAARVLVPGGRLVYFAGEGAAPTPTEASVQVRRSPVLESSGPLVIMTRQ